MPETFIQGKGLRLNVLGRQVSRAASLTPQTTAFAIFTILGGRILLTSIVGEVTVALAGAANDMKLIANPTTGTSVDMCTATETNGKEAGALLSITGLPSDALIVANAGCVSNMARGLVLPIGGIDWDCAASRAGQIKWVMTYVPVDDGAYVAAA